MPNHLYLYCLEFTNCKKYIGVTENPRRRLAEHHEPKSRCVYIRRAIKKYGSPKFTVLCIGPMDYILELEVKAIAAFKTQDRDFGYNIAAGGKISPALTKEVAEKIRTTLAGREPSAKNRVKSSAFHKGRPKSPEQRAKMSASAKGRIITPEMRAKISATLTGRSPTPEARAKISATLSGKKRPYNITRNQSLEHRAKVSAATRGKPRKPLSPEHRAKISATLKITKKNPGVSTGAYV